MLDENLQEWELQWRRRFLMATRHARKVVIEVCSSADPAFYFPSPWRVEKPGTTL